MLTTFRQSPFLRLTVFFASGIVAQTYHNFAPLWYYLSAFSAVVIAVSFIPRIAAEYSLRWLFGTGIALLCISGAGILTSQEWKKSEWNYGETKQQYRVQILDEAVRKPASLMFRVSVGDRQAMIYLPVDSVSEQLQPADSLIINARFEQVAYRYQRVHNIAARAFVRDFIKIDTDEKNAFNLHFAALRCRRALLTQLDSVIAGKNEFAVAGALLFGYRSEIDYELRQTFASTGSSHILSISGLHFSILYGVLYFMFSFLGNGRRGRIIRQSIILPLMWIFAFLVGMSPSVVRAATMLTLWGVGNAFMLSAFTMNTAGAAAFLMLLYNPLNLFDVGFQLSFSAVFAILLLYKHFEGLLAPQNPILTYLWQLTCVSVAAQIGTAPLSVYYFHQFPVIFLITNFVAIPLTAVLLTLLPSTLILSYIIGTETILMKPVNFVLTVFLDTLQWLENIPNGLIRIGDVAWTDVVVMYAMIFAVGLTVLRKRATYLVAGLLIIFGWWAVEALLR